MKDYHLIRYCGNEMTVAGLLWVWCLGWIGFFRGFIRIASLGTLDTDVELWFLVRTKP